MKTLLASIRLLLLSLCIITSFSACDNEDENPDNSKDFDYGTLLDQDGNTYKTITIGEQEWMAENLKTTKYNDGTEIPLIIGDFDWANMTSAGYCWFDNDYESYGETYGAIYNWYVIETNKLCPSGWHVPTDSDWKELEKTMGMTNSEIETERGYRGINEGSKLAGKKELWDDGELEKNPSFGEAGFLAIPSGIREEAYFLQPGMSGVWWTATENNVEKAWIRMINFNRSNIWRMDGSKAGGYSIRCVKD
ncbi:fibrobacter succinogenes major paralogous domain-containing protein [Carboxylicivirga taeanensis]|uniref:fibrobacter succinogenes major paralogous domain-containing protein n=1 Tax=Carboxylicivirga taeanensis TaxID=1416875 RepID=UPI003F6DE55A